LALNVCQGFCSHAVIDILSYGFQACAFGSGVLHFGEQ